MEEDRQKCMTACMNDFLRQASYDSDAFGNTIALERKNPISKTDLYPQAAHPRMKLKLLVQLFRFEVHSQGSNA